MAPLRTVSTWACGPLGPPVFSPPTPPTPRVGGFGGGLSGRLAGEGIDHPADLLQFVLVHLVAHPRVEAHSDLGLLPRQRLGAVHDALLRDVGIHVAAPQEDRGALERPLVLEARTRRSDQPAAQARDPAIAPRIPRRV